MFSWHVHGPLTTELLFSADVIKGFKDTINPNLCNFELPFLKVLPG